MKKEKGVISTFYKGVVHEERDTFDTSVFSKVYRRTSALVEECVQSQMEAARMRGTKEPQDNIITFIGRRGTGKSSTMLSFMQGLLKNSSDENEASDYTIKTKSGKRVQFIGIDWIDASMLEEGEDIFETILAKMLGEFLNDDENGKNLGNAQDYEKRDLHNRFGKIYKKVLNLKKRNEKSDFAGEAAISTLRDLARSNDLRIEFESLVHKYIDVKRFQNANGNLSKYSETFLVVAIDDVDMNVDSGFEILEKIQRYLKVEGLIVLLAINYEQMKICCEKHFAKVYSDYSRSFTSDMQKYVTKVAEEYMEKVLPSYMRVYLPSLKKKDYDREQQTQIEISARNEKKIRTSIKNGIFILAEQKTMVRYDSEGKKRHFMEPETLRGLNNYCVFLESMRNLDEEDNDFLEKLDFNNRRSMDDLLFRFAYENLPQRERKLFISLSEEDIRRRGELIVSAFLREITRKDWNELRFINPSDEKHIHLFEKEFKTFGYNYGELMRCFYCLGREDIFDKKLVHSFLFMYSLVLTKIFYRYKACIDSTDQERCEIRNRNYRMLKDLMNGSVSGSWSLHMVPKMVRSGIVNRPLFSGTVKEVHLENKTMNVAPGISVLIEKIKLLTENQEEKYILQIEELAEQMKPQLIVLMFLSTDEKYSFTLEKESQILDGMEFERDRFTGSGQLNIKLGISKADYNITNFINNIFIFDDILKDFINALCKMSGNEKFKADKNLTDRIIKKLLENSSSFYGEMEKWKLENGGMVVPVYSTDIFYNMLKRLARELKRNPVEPIREEQLFSSLQDLIKRMREHLERADRPYEFDKKKNFSYIMDQCPFIKELLVKKDNTIEPIFNAFVASLISSNENKNQEFEEMDRFAQYLD